MTFERALLHSKTMGLVCLVVKFYKIMSKRLKNKSDFNNISNNFIRNRLKNNLYLLSLKLYYRSEKIETLYIIISTYVQQHINAMHGSVFHIEHEPENKPRWNFCKFQLFGY